MENKSENKQNTIFILGSGASNFLGYPLLRELHYDSLEILYEEIITCIDNEVKELITDEDKSDTKKLIIDLYDKFKNKQIKDLEFLQAIKKIIWQLDKVDCTPCSRQE